MRPSALPCQLTRDAHGVRLADSQHGHVSDPGSCQRAAGDRRSMLGVRRQGVVDGAYLVLIAVCVSRKKVLASSLLRR